MCVCQLVCACVHVYVWQTKLEEVADNLEELAEQLYTHTNTS